MRESSVIFCTATVTSNLPNTLLQSLQTPHRADCLAAPLFSRRRRRGATGLGLYFHVQRNRDFDVVLGSCAQIIPPEIPKIKSSIPFGVLFSGHYYQKKVQTSFYCRCTKQRKIQNMGILLDFSQIVYRSSIAGVKMIPPPSGKPPRPRRAYQALQKWGIGIF